jgi:hypothetical protein
MTSRARHTLIVVGTVALFTVLGGAALLFVTWDVMGASPPVYLAAWAVGLLLGAASGVERLRRSNAVTADHNRPHE